MQVPTAFYSSASQPTIFETILEECSMRDIAPEQPDSLPDAPCDHLPQLQREGSWFWLQEEPFEQVHQPDPLEEALSVEFRRVKSLREEQEGKIAMFLREDKQKGRTEPMKNESPLGKNSQSLSPRKTKKIDKTKPLRLFQETC